MKLLSSTTDVLAALGTALRHAPMNVAFAQINWSKLAQSFALVGSSPRTSGLAQVSSAGDGGSDQHVRSTILAARDQQRQGIASDYLHRKVATVLKVEPAAVEPSRPLHELGLDSLTAFELKNRIETDLGVSLPMTGLIEGPSIARVAAQLLPLLDGAPAHTA